MDFLLRTEHGVWYRINHQIQFIKKEIHHSTSLYTSLHHRILLYSIVHHSIPHTMVIVKKVSLENL